MTTKTTTPAQDVINAFPTFADILTKPEYQAQIFEDRGAKALIMLSPGGGEVMCAETVATLVNHMVTSMMDLSFFDTYNMLTAKSITEVKDWTGAKHPVNRDEFQALLKVFWFSYLGIKMTDAQFEAYIAFKSIPKIYRIMD